MGKYENKIAIESCVKTIHKQQRTEHKVQSVIDELEMAYDKAKAFDKISNLIEENYVDYGENNLEDIETIVNEYWEDK